MPRQFKVTVNGREYDVTVLELTAGQSASPVGGPAAAAAGRRRPGVAPPLRRRPRRPRPRRPRRRRRRGRRHGRRRRRGARQGRPDGGQRGPLLVLEAMKMKTPVIASRGGQVTRVLVAPGDPVEGGQPLVTIALSLSRTGRKLSFLPSCNSLRRPAVMRPGARTDAYGRHQFSRSVPGNRHPGGLRTEDHVRAHLPDAARFPAHLPGLEERPRAAADDPDGARHVVGQRRRDVPRRPNAWERSSSIPLLADPIDS
jgi:hypothetical protein